MTKYGYASSDWDEAKEEMRAVLIERAKEGLPIAYSDLVARVKTIRLEPHSYALAAMLGEISSEEDDFGRGMLSVIVVYKDSGMEPGPGFFELARQRGHDISNKDAFWIQELKKVHEYWSGRA